MQDFTPSCDFPGTLDVARRWDEPNGYAHKHFMTPRSWELFAQDPRRASRSWIHWGAYFGWDQYRDLRDSHQWDEYRNLPLKAWDLLEAFLNRRGTTRPNYRGLFVHWVMERLIEAHMRRYPWAAFSADGLTYALAGHYYFLMTRPWMTRMCSYKLYLKPTSLLARGLVQHARKRDFAEPWDTAPGTRSAWAIETRDLVRQGADISELPRWRNRRVTPYWYTLYRLTAVNPWPDCDNREWLKTTFRYAMGRDWRTEFFPDWDEYIRSCSLPPVQFNPRVVSGLERSTRAARMLLRGKLPPEEAASLAPLTARAERILGNYPEMVAVWRGRGSVPQALEPQYAETPRVSASLGVGVRTSWSQ